MRIKFFPRKWKVIAKHVEVVNMKAILYYIYMYVGRTPSSEKYRITRVLYLNIYTSYATLSSCIP